MTLTQVKTDIASLTIAEKATVIEFLLQTLSKGSQGITKTPGVCGGDACIDRTRLPVWLFVSLRFQGAFDCTFKDQTMLVLLFVLMTRT